MKLLSNPWVTYSLAAAAVLVVGYQVFAPRWQRAATYAHPRAAAAPVAPPPQAVAPASETPPPAPPALEPAQPIDQHYVEAHTPEWVSGPRRDPFLLVPAVAPALGKPTRRYPSPVSKWKLKAIWRQAGSRVAAIDNKVYVEGDSIDGYKIETIDSDQVWFQGPDSKERLGFSPPEPAAARKAAH